jgi:hypothetical protein
MLSEIARWSGRIIGGFGVLMWAFALIAQTFVEPIRESLDPEAIGLATLVVVNVAAFFVALRNERRGGIATLIVGSAFSVFALATAGHNHWLAALVSGGPFIFAGAMFVLASRLDEAGDHSTAMTTA